ALLTNGGKPLHLYLDVFRKVLGDLAGVEVPPLPEPNAAEAPADPSRYVGEYSSQVADIVVSQDEDGGLWLERTPKGVFADLGSGPEKNRLLGYKGDTLVAEHGELGLHLPHAFVGDDGNGRALYVHTGRADRRVSR
ncbi:MAG TPA: serine hydrolase, partial [Amycolatopsis sp.]|nr:serine hydrolase [Amycolatopsis sp.]